MPHKNRPGEFDRLVREALLDLYKRVFGGLPGTAGLSFGGAELAEFRSGLSVIAQHFGLSSVELERRFGFVSGAEEQLVLGEPPPLPPELEGGFGFRDFLAAALGWGLPLTPEIRGLAQQGAAQSWTINEFWFRLRRTPTYANRFPGIVGPDGVPLMSEAEYIARENFYRDTAAVLGMDLSAGQIAFLFENRISPQVFQIRIQGVRRLKDDDILFRQFGRVLQIRGVAKAPPTRKELYDFVMGMADPRWYNVWREAETRAAAREAGFKISPRPGERAGGLATVVGRGVKAFEAPILSGRELRRLSREGVTEEEFAALAEQFLTTVPLARAQRVGLTKRDIKQAVIGGPRAAGARQKIRRILAQEAARQQPIVSGAGLEAIETGFAPAGAERRRRPRGQ